MLHSMESPGNIRINPDRKAKRVLIVEDDPSYRKIIAEYLTPEWEVSSAENGLIGFELAKTETPDLIISDLLMPVLDGAEMVIKLRAEDKTHRIPILLLSAKSDEESRIKSFRSGIDQFLKKPFSKEELTVRVNNLYRRSLRYQATEASQGYQDSFIEQLKSILENQLSNTNLGVAQLADRMSMSRAQLHRRLMHTYQITPTDYIRNFRLDKARKLLMDPSITVAEVAHRVGFRSPSYFTKTFKLVYGETPMHRKGKRG